MIVHRVSGGSIIAVLCLTVALVAPASRANANDTPSITVTISWSGAERFRSYDHRSADFQDVDWPTQYIFTNHADISSVKGRICQYMNICDSGGPMNMAVDDDGGPGGGAWSGIDQDSGIKRNSTCGDWTYWNHMRLYAPEVTYPGNFDESFYDAWNGFYVVGTSHLDLHDVDGCPGREHGWGATSESWWNGAIQAYVPSSIWTINPDASYWDLQNANTLHKVYRTLGGQSVPHYYENDSHPTHVNVLVN